MNSQVEANRKYRQKNRDLVNEKERIRYAKMKENKPDVYEKKLTKAKEKARIQREYRKAIRSEERQLLQIVF
jgi:TRAP-type C4-dicarboxylate transport system substrate-binding protein